MESQASPPRKAKGHRDSCTCTLCARIKARIAAGKPPKAVARAMGHQRRIERAKDKRIGTTPRNKSEQRIAKRAMLTGAIVGQAAAGVRPNIARAARIAGIDPSQAQRQIRRDESIQAALARAGITDAKLFELAAEALAAENVRLITNRDGNLTDAISFPDWLARHKFWQDLLKVKGFLGREEPPAPVGGLIIIAPDAAKVLPGHAATCMCQECIAAWDEKTKELRRLEARRSAIDAEISDNAIDGAPSNDLAPPGTEEEEDFYEADPPRSSIAVPRKPEPEKPAAETTTASDSDDEEDYYQT